MGTPRRLLLKKEKARLYILKWCLEMLKVLGQVKAQWAKEIHMVVGSMQQEGKHVC